MNKLLLFSVFSILTLNVMAQEKIVQTAGRDQLGTFAPKFAELNDDVLFGEVWSRTDKLSLRDRSLVTITSLISMGITDNSLVYHLQSAKKNGITRTEIAEIITHIGFYAGWPKAWAAFNLAKGVWSEDIVGEADIEPMITYGTNPGMGMGITQHIPTMEGMSEAAQVSFKKSMEYMGFQPGESLLGKKIDYVFLGACTNGRIEDFRAFASIVKGRKKAENVIAWLVPGSWMVDAQIRKEGIDKILTEAGFAIRQPGCSACLAMNDDKIPAGKYSVSTSNRNFEGRQGPGARTLLASPLVAAAAAVTGVITDPRELM